MCIRDSIEAGSRSGAFSSNVKWIGRAVPKAGRRGTRLGYKDNILRNAPSIARVTKKKGRTLTCSIRMPPDGRELSIASETDVFHVISRPIIDDNGIGRFKKSPLATAVIASLEAVGMEGSNRVDEIEPEIAKDYIASFELTGKTKANDLTLRLDKATVTEQRELLAAPWHEVTLDITVKDEQHIAHLATDQLLVVHDHPLEKPKKKRPPPMAEQAPPRAEQRSVLFTATQIWIAERRGTSLTIRSGKRANRYLRKEKTTTFPTDEKATLAFDKAVLAKRKEKYKAGPTLDEATATVEKRLGLALFANEAGVLVVTKAGPPSDRLGDDERRWFKPNDHVTSVRPERGPAQEMQPMSVEELALAIAAIPAKAGVWLGCFRPAASVGTGVNVNLR